MSFDVHQPGMPPAPTPAAPAPQAPPIGQLRLHLQGNPLISMFTPRVQVDGAQLPAVYGDNAFAVYAGRHLVTAYVPWLLRFGHASAQVDVTPGGTTELWYAPPLFVFLGGRMGPTKQEFAGLLAMPFVVVGLLLVFALIAF